MLPYIIFGALTVVAVAKAKPAKKPGEMSPQATYALQRLLDDKDATPAQFNKAADAFEKHGYKPEAELLRKRAKLRALPPEEKRKMRDAIKAAHASNKPDGIRALARVLLARGAVGASKLLMTRADAVAAANNIQSREVPPPSPEETTEEDQTETTSEETETPAVDQVQTDVPTPPIVEPEGLDDISGEDESLLNAKE
jgi:hypothetical protein